jgi:GntR family transcriptional regulator
MTPGPRYRVIIADIRANIADGTLKSGDRLPSTVEFCNTYDVSATVVNQAVLVLTSAGLIHGVPGVGRFVS